MAGANDSIENKKRNKFLSLLKFIPSVALLPFTFAPFLVLVAWEITEKPIRAIGKRFFSTDWAKVGQVLALVGEDAADTAPGRAIRSFLRLPVIRHVTHEISKVTGEFGHSTGSFVQACRNSGPWGGLLGSTAFFVSIVSLSAAATIVKIPLLIYHAADLPQLTSTGLTWLLNHAPTALNHTVLPVANFFSYGPSLVTKMFGFSLHLNPLSNFSFNAPQVPVVVTDFLHRFKPDWFPFEKIPYFGKYLAPWVGTEEAALDSAIHLAIAAKLIKPVLGPLYILFPQMKNHLPYKAAVWVLHRIGDAVLYSLKGCAYPFKQTAEFYKSTPLHSITSASWNTLLKGSAELKKSLLAASVSDKNGPLSYTAKLTTRPLYAISRFFRSNVHNYFENKINQVGSIDYVEKKSVNQTRTYGSDISYAFQHPLNLITGTIKTGIAATPSLGTVAVIAASIYALPIAGPIGSAAVLYAGTRVTGKVREAITYITNAPIQPPQTSLSDINHATGNGINILPVNTPSPQIDNAPNLSSTVDSLYAASSAPEKWQILKQLLPQPASSTSSHAIELVIDPSIPVVKAQLIAAAKAEGVALTVRFEGVRGEQPALSLRYKEAGLS